MKKFILLALLATSQANALVEFHTGEVVTASDMNGNFKELEEKIKAPAAFEPNALANGEPVYVQSYSTGSYGLTYSDNNYIYIFAEGYPRISVFYFEESGCTGSAYLQEHSIPKDAEIGVEFLNPLMSTREAYSYDGVNLYKGTSETKVRLNYKSMSRSGVCSPAEGVTIAAQAIPTRDLTLPISITEIGTSLIVSEVVGTEPEVEEIQSANVYANGVFIGVTNYVPNKFYSLRVTLKEYNQQTISLRKDGTYYGFDNGGFPSRSLYYLDQNCVGNAYVKTRDHLTYFWDIQPGAQSALKNGTKYYTAEGQYYNASSGVASRRNNDGSCYSFDYDNRQHETDIFQIATETDNPELIAPVLEPPITIDGWYPVQQNDLPEAR
jgi:hypothetical protein